MEKLQATKKIKINQSNSISKKDLLKNKSIAKKKNDFKQSSMYKWLKEILCIIKTCKVLVISVFLLFCLTILASSLTISNNGYYMFLNRPKILQDAGLLLSIIIIFLTILLVHFVTNLISISKRNGSKYFDAFLNTEQQTNKNEHYNKIDDKLKNNKNSKKTLSKSHKKEIIKTCNYRQYLFIFLSFLAITLLFHLHLLWGCVFVCFAVFFSLFVLIFKSHGKISKIISIVLLLNFVCILLSFYFIYLLN